MANDPPTSSAAPIQNILLDTNIIQYAGNAPSGIEFLKYLIELQKRHFGLAISDVSFFEILRNTTKKQEQEIITILNIFYRYFVSKEVLIAGAQLSTLYREHCNLKGDIDYGDIFIASTSILTNSLILTRNRKDFPFPFFIEAEVKTLYIIKSPGHTDGFTICLLTPNYEAIYRLFAIRK
jgi:predicted nucleic acid-binding protein